METEMIGRAKPSV